MSRTAVPADNSQVPLLTGVDELITIISDVYVLVNWKFTFPYVSVKIRFFVCVRFCFGKLRLACGFDLCVSVNRSFLSLSCVDTGA